MSDWSAIGRHELVNYLLCAEAERDAAIRALEAVEAALTLHGRSSIRVVAAREAINDWRDGEAP